MAKHWFGVALLAACVGAATVRGQQAAPPAHPPAFGKDHNSAFGLGPAGADCPLPGGEECEPPGPFPAANAFGEDCPPPGAAPCTQLTLEYLFLWFRGQRTPPLVTTGDVSDPIPGALGQPGTRVLSGGDSVGGDLAAAFRVSFVYWLCHPERLSLDANYFIMEQRSAGFSAQTDGSVGTPVLARPYFNPNFNREDADPRALPNVLAGNAQYQLLTRLMGAELNTRFDLTGKTIFGPTCYLLGGVRYLRLDEKYLSAETVTDRPSGRDNTFFISDNFTTYNEFYGAQGGAQIHWCCHNFLVDVTGKVAVGENRRTLRVSGLTTITNAAGNVVSDDFGLFAQPTNIGSRRDDTIAVVPELAVNLTCVVNDHINVKLGYTLLFFTDVIRPGEQLDRNISIQPLLAPGQIGRPFPQRLFEESDFWVQFINLGVELVF